ncbi:hypothetical protein MIZ03_3249 [Rhodoferax lithotrophicus]|uniref:Uncharacterized protein n=1 Tax=Rhodoferax lithotrophicus TaxID=2798804 RepID=A0ABM7MPU9_9BURK|nr:hypothetical protein MIZ03_3249 [Rhodoferax sp. MIZ03]
MSAGNGGKLSPFKLQIVMDWRNDMHLTRHKVPHPHRVWLLARLDFHPWTTDEIFITTSNEKCYHLQTRTILNKETP